jgi:hypothetical protein
MHGSPAAPGGSSTFASNAIAAGIDVFELARVMGTSVHPLDAPVRLVALEPKRPSPVHRKTCISPRRIAPCRLRAAVVS